MTPYYNKNHEVIGFYKRIRKLELRTINNAGHMVPMDQPEGSLNMMNEFIKNTLGAPEEDTSTIENVMIDE